MAVRRTCAITAVSVALTLILGLSAHAGEILAFKQQQLKFVRPAANFYVKCASVTIKAPQEKGYVVVTATGTSLFDVTSTNADLVLTLATQAQVAGPAISVVTPGFPALQSWTVRYVFFVQAGATATYYLNGKSTVGRGSSISVETNSMTAEFYPTSQTQRNKVTEDPVEQPSKKAVEQQHQ
jgi:hypothetical protein